MKHCHIIFIILVSGLSACSGPLPEELIKLDKEFSDLSREKGMKYAFMEYAAHSAESKWKYILDGGNEGL